MVNSVACNVSKCNHSMSCCDSQMRNNSVLAPLCETNFSQALEEISVVLLYACLDTLGVEEPHQWWNAHTLASVNNILNIDASYSPPALLQKNMHTQYYRPLPEPTSAQGSRAGSPWQPAVLRSLILQPTKATYSVLNVEQCGATAATGTVGAEQRTCLTCEQVYTLCTKV